MKRPQLLCCLPMRKEEAFTFVSICDLSLYYVAYLLRNGVLRGKQKLRL